MSAKKPVALDDGNIVQRVKEYLEKNVDKTYVDVGEMSTCLRQRYSEYGSRPQNKFRKLVEQAYRVVSLSLGVECAGSSNDGSDDDVKLMGDDGPATKNMMKNIMNEMYKSKSPAKETNSKAVAIDISSDDDDENDAAGKDKNQKKIDQNAANAAAVNSFLSRITVTTVANVNNNASNGKVNAAAQNPKAPKIGHKRRDENVDDGNPAKKMMTNMQMLHQMRENPMAAAAAQIYRNGFHSAAAAAAAGVSGCLPKNEHQQQQQQQQQPIKKYKKLVAVQSSAVSFQNLGGIEKQLKELCEILIHLKVPDIYYELGVIPPRGILIYGPSGCGKSMLASAIAGQLNMDIINVPATELIAGVSGESEERIRDIFEQAKAAAPCVLFIDDIDNISTNRLQAQKEMERRVVSQLISSIDSLRTGNSAGDVLLIGATTRPDALDPALRREGRFDHEIALTIPNRKERKEILRVVCDGIRVDPKLDYDKIAELTPGYVGADIVALTSRAATVAVKNKWMEQMHKLQAERPITIVDLDDDETINDDDKEEKEKDETEKEKGVTEEVEKEVENKEDANKESKEENNEKEKDAAAAEVSPPAPPASAKETDEAGKKFNGETMDIDDEICEEKKDEEQKNAEQKIISEPSLAEMINWLDSPPEDCVLEDFCVTLEDFLDAIKLIQPAAKREGFITVPDVTWNEIGSLHDIREELRLAILAPVKYPDVMVRLGLQAPAGVLLCGPPGCGKTLIAKAIANEAGINFISVKGPELMNMYVGESERAVRACFQRARNSAPCVIFFDEFDSLCPKRSSSNDSSSGTRIVNQLLTEMDGIQERKGVYIMAASNRPDIIDPAILRPGRLDSVLYVGMPDVKDRKEILIAATKNRTNPMLAKDVDLDDIARRTDGYTGADLTGLLRQAAMVALKECIAKGTPTEELCVHKHHFVRALQLVRPSISADERKTYDNLRSKYAAPRKSF